MEILIRIPRLACSHYTRIDGLGGMTKIFESPDKGHTVYARDIGSSERELVELSQPVTDILNRWTRWITILKIAETNPTLRDAVDKVEMIYALIKKEPY
jgi:hypothetical protein